MLCAIAELESDRQPLCTHYIKKSKAFTMGIMQILPKTAEWLVRYIPITHSGLLVCRKIVYNENL